MRAQLLEFSIGRGSGAPKELSSPKLRGSIREKKWCTSIVACVLKMVGLR